MLRHPATGAFVLTIACLEHVFRVDRGSEKGINWTLYDVGGARNQVCSHSVQSLSTLIFASGSGMLGPVSLTT